MGVGFTPFTVMKVNRFTELYVELVVTSFPRRWGRKKQDPSGLYRTIRERLADRPDLDNVYDMATMMIEQCSRVFFDRAVSKDNRPEVMDIFSTAIGDVVCHKSNTFEKFLKLILTRPIGPRMPTTSSGT